MNACIPIVRVSFVVQLLWPLYCVTCETSMQAQNPPPFITVDCVCVCVCVCVHPCTLPPLPCHSFGEHGHAHASSTFSDRRHARCGDCPACQWLNTNGLVSLFPYGLVPSWPCSLTEPGLTRRDRLSHVAGDAPLACRLSLPPHRSLVDAAWQRATEALHAPLSSAWHKRSEVKNTEVVTVARATSFSPLVWERARYQWPRGFFIIALLVHVCFITEVVLMNRYWRDSKDESILSIKPFNLI